MRPQFPPELFVQDHGSNVLAHHRYSAVPLPEQLASLGQRKVVAIYVLKEVAAIETVVKVTKVDA